MVTRLTAVGGAAEGIFQLLPVGFGERGFGGLFLRAFVSGAEKEFFALLKVFLL